MFCAIGSVRASQMALGPVLAHAHVRAELAQPVPCVMPFCPLATRSAALAALEKESGLLYDDTKLPLASQLMQVRCHRYQSRLPHPHPLRIPQRV